MPRQQSGTPAWPKFSVSIEQYGIAHGKAKSADAARLREACVKKCVGSDRIPVKVPDCPWRAAVAVTGIVKDKRRYAIVMEETLYADPLRNRFAHSVEDEERDPGLAGGGCFDKVGIQETAAARDLEPLISKLDGGRCLWAVRASGYHGLL